MGNKSNLVLEVGKTYRLDKRFRNSSLVKVMEVYGKHFCRVKSVDPTHGNEEWDTMCNRLSVDESIDNLSSTND